MHLAPVQAARVRCAPRPGWCALFLKAYALVAARRPVLRRAYLSWPWPHFYEHSENVASVALERRWGDEDAVFFTLLPRAEEKSLARIETYLHERKEAPLESIAAFRRILRMSRLPLPLRRLAWWAGFSLSGSLRARYMGTFGLSVTSSRGAASLGLLSPTATTLTYGVMGADATLDVRLTYDHRVLDGGTVAAVLADLEEALHGPLVAEMRETAEAAEEPAAHRRESDGDERVQELLA